MITFSPSHRNIYSSAVFTPILCTVDVSSTESLLTVSFVCRFSSLSVEDTKQPKHFSSGLLQNNSAKWFKVSVGETEELQRAESIINQHVLSKWLHLLPSGRGYRAPPRKSNCYSKSFIPSAVRWPSSPFIFLSSVVLVKYTFWLIGTFRSK